MDGCSDEESTIIYDDEHGFIPWWVRCRHFTFSPESYEISFHHGRAHLTWPSPEGIVGPASLAGVFSKKKYPKMTAPRGPFDIWNDTKGISNMLFHFMIKTYIHVYCIRTRMGWEIVQWSNASPIPFTKLCKPSIQEIPLTNWSIFFIGSTRW